MNIKDYLVEILTTIVLIASAIFLFFNAYYQPLMRYQNDIVKLSKYYEQQKVKLQKDIAKQQEKDTLKDNTLNSVPKILKAINNTCKDSDIIIRKLSPFKDNPFKFELHIITTYFKFIKILSEFEKLNISIENINLDEYETSLDNPKKVITLIIKVTGKVDDTQKKVKEKLEEIIANNSSKNPFQTNMLDEKGVVVRAINLTYIYTLSSVTPIKGDPFATIDNRDYHIGDKFLDKGVVKKIENGKVRIFKKLDNGTKQEYFIGFRRKHKIKE